MKCATCGYDDLGTGDSAHSCRAAPVAQLDADLPPPGLRIAHAELSEKLGREAAENLSLRMENRQYVERIRHLETAYAAATSLAGDTINARNAEVAEQGARIRHLERELAGAQAAPKVAETRMATGSDGGAQPEQSIEQEVAAVFRGCGFEVREYLGAQNQFTVCGSLDSAALLLATVMPAEVISGTERFHWTRKGMELDPNGFYTHYRASDDIDGRTAGTASEAAPDAWVYECRQPLTDPVVWAEFFGRDKPSASTWVRNVRPLAYIDQHAAAKPLCPHCGTHEVELSRTCHNSACTGYASPETIYEGWIAAAPSTQEGANEN